MRGRAPGRPSLRPCARPRQRSFRPSFPLPFPASGGWKEPPSPPPLAPARGGPRAFLQFSRTHLKDAFLALLDELSNLLSSLASNLLVERGAVLVAHGFAALSPPELTTLPADLLVEADAALIANALATLPADLLVERSAALRLDRLAALLADLLVEAGAALRFDGVAALLADLLVEGAAPLRLHRLAALAADLLVEGVPVLVAHRLAALAACLRHAHRALLLARILFSHSRPLTRPCPEQIGFARAGMSRAASRARPCGPPRSDRARAARRAFRSPGRTRPRAPP